MKTPLKTRVRIKTVVRQLLAGAAMAMLAVALVAPVLPAAADEDDPFGGMILDQSDLDRADDMVADPLGGVIDDDVLDRGDADSLLDSDGDGLSDGAERDTYGTDPNLADTDGDFISDETELNLYGTDPRNADTDGDSLNDNDEFIYGASPLVWDTDGDRLRDGNEVYIYGTMPNDPNTDNDSGWDGHELDVCSDPLDPNEEVGNYNNTPCTDTPHS